MDAATKSSEVTLTSSIVQRILASARNGEYRPADRLPSERHLAEQLNVSRNTITAAYAALERLGVIRRIQGKGAFLCALPAEEASFSWSGKISRFANLLDEPVLELLARRCAGEIPYPFSAGTPSLEIFSKELYTTSLARVTEEHLPAALAVAPTEGQWTLREKIGNWLSVPPQNVMITAGAQEGIDLLARCLVAPGDYVVVDAPTYPGAIQSFLSAGAQLLPWGTDWSLGQLENLLLRYRPKLVFTTPTFHNPTGRVMSLKVRKGLLDLVSRYKVPIIEDDVYSRAYFGQHSMPESLYKLDQHSQVVSISTFSKIVAPGLRIGWLTAPLYMVKQLSLIKMRSNLFTGGLNQLVLADLIGTGGIEVQLDSMRAHHCDLCESAVAALQPLIQAGLLRCRIPSGSLYLWCKVVPPIDVEAFLATLEAKGVSMAPGTAFDPERKKAYSSHFRLCFTAVTKKKLLQGIRILQDELESASQHSAHFE